MILRARDGDLAAREELVLRHLPFIQYTARKFFGRYLGSLSTEDLEQIAVQAFVESMNTYDPDRGIRLTTFGGGWIRGRILDALARRRIVRSAIKRDFLPGDPRGVVLSLDVTDSETLASDSAPPVSDEAEESERSEMIRDALRHLPFRERQMIVARFGLGTRPPMTLREVGEIHKISAERVRQLLNRAMATMKDHLPIPKDILP